VVACLNIGFEFAENLIFLLSCSNLANYPEALHSASGALVNGVPTICGGLDQTSSTGVVPNCYNFDKNMGKWTSFANITGRYASSAVLLNEGLWLAGGVTRPVGSATTSTVDTSILINSETGLVDGSIDLPTVRRDHCAVKLHDDRVMIIGSDSTGSYKKSAIIFDPRGKTYANQMSTVPDLLFDRQRAACGWFYSPLHNNRPVVFAVGGDNEATAEVYDYTVALVSSGSSTFEKSWEQIGSLPTTYQSSFGGATAVTSATLDGAYVQHEEHLYELQCDPVSCKWKIMPQKLKVGRNQAVMMQLSTGFSCNNNLIDVV